MLAFNPWFITGLTDAEGCFSVSIIKVKTCRLGYSLRLDYAINLAIRDKNLILQIKKFFNFGNISYSKDRSSIKFTVTNFIDLGIIIKFFQKFPLLTSKRHDFNLFVTVYEIVGRKEHLTVFGLLRAIAITNNINFPVKPELLAKLVQAFGPLPKLRMPPVTILDRFLVIPSPWWIIGFICGEGSFSYHEMTSSKMNSGQLLRFGLRFEVSQRTKDIYLLYAISIFLGFGNITSDKKRGMSKLTSANLTFLQQILIPFLLAHPIPGFKGLQFQMWLPAVVVRLQCSALKTYTSEDSDKLARILSDLTKLRDK
jgi:hypothetical protein